MEVGRALLAAEGVEQRKEAGNKNSWAGLAGVWGQERPQEEGFHRSGPRLLRI